MYSNEKKNEYTYITIVFGIHLDFFYKYLEIKHLYIKYGESEKNIPKNTRRPLYYSLRPSLLGGKRKKNERARKY